MTRDHFIFYRSFKNAVQKLPIELQLDMLYTIIDYALDGQEPPSDGGIVGAIFDLVRPQIDANNVKYVNGCKGAEHGKKGGAPKGNSNATKNKTTPKQPQNNPETTRNDNENDNDNVNDDDARARVRDGCFSSSSSTALEMLANSEPASRIVCDCVCELTEQDAQAVINAFASSEWLQGNITSLKWVQEHLPQITSGYYVTYKKPSDKTNNRQDTLDTQRTTEELYALFTQVGDDDE